MTLAPGLIQQTIQAYKNGAFPMAENGIIGFYTCDPRSVFFFDQFHTPRRLKRIQKKSPLYFSVNRAFEHVVQCCRLGREEWISDQLVEIYLDLHDLRIAHSIEAWQDDKIVGGIYGTQFGAAFIAESMYHTTSHASNLCLLFLIELLQKSGFHFCDIQYANMHTERFNPTPVPQQQFQVMLKNAMSEEIIPLDDLHYNTNGEES